MSDQESRDRILDAIEDLKRTHERSIEDVKETMAENKRTTEHAIAEVKRTTENSFAEVKETMAADKRTTEHAIAEVKRTTERSLEEIRHDVKSINDRLQSVGQDVAWTKGALEGKQEAISNKDAKSAIWIALGSAVAAIVSLIKSFW